MLYHNYFHGKLSRSIQPGNVIETYYPKKSELSYEVTRITKDPSKEPIYLDFSEHYMLLSEVISFSLNFFPNVDFILIKLRMPGMGKLTKGLLNEKVLLCLDVESEKDTLLTLNKQFLTVEANLKRTQVEDSDNSVIVNAYTFEDKTVEFGLLRSLFEKFGVKNIE